MIERDDGYYWVDYRGHWEMSFYTNHDKCFTINYDSDPPSPTYLYDGRDKFKIHEQRIVEPS